MIHRRTKIVATLGPSTDDPAVMRQLILAGVDVVRLNFSHGTREDHASRAALVREIAGELGRDVAILGDLQGPKIRVECFKDGPVELTDGSEFVLDTAHPKQEGDQHIVGLAYKALPSDVSAGSVLMLNDGLIMLTVKKVDGTRIITDVTIGGTLSDRKGINKQGGGLSAAALTEKDKGDIQTAAELEFDYLAVSFPKNAADMMEARQLLEIAGGRASLVAKVERAEAVVNLAEIIEASDAIMVARGDLAVEVGDAELPGLQKQMIHDARERNRVVITATQMMESMIINPVPTRAEVSDVANAVIDGTDAVMLSAETASGKYPVKTVQAMDRVCKAAEKHSMTMRSGHRIDEDFERVDEAIAMATMYTANHLHVKAIVSFTESGYTGLWMSRIRSGIPIFAFTRQPATRRRVCLYRGVYPVPFDIIDRDPADILSDATDTLTYMKAVEPGDLVVFTKGDFDGIAGGTNTMRVHRVERPKERVEDLSRDLDFGDSGG
jgi:pyruvate kinase